MSGLSTFKQKLKEDGYAGPTAARRAIGKVKDISDEERAAGYRAVDKHFGVDSKAPKKAAAKKPKKAPKKVKASKIEAAKNALSKKKAGSAAKGQVSVTEVAAAAKKAGPKYGPGKGRMKKKAPTKKEPAKKQSKPSAPVRASNESARTAINEAVEAVPLLERGAEIAREQAQAFPGVDHTPLAETIKDGLTNVFQRMLGLSRDIGGQLKNTQASASPPAGGGNGTPEAPAPAVPPTGALPGLPTTLPGMPTQ